MNYKKALDILLNMPMFQKVGTKAFIPTMDNIIGLTSLLDNPQEKFPTIHIAGTNGKGSTSHILSSVLQEAGYKVGLYTSPHLLDYRERIRINGELVNKKIVENFMDIIEEYMNNHKTSFFEITTALAFYAFKQEKVDIAIIETGLGGRYDSTNIIKPLLSIITNISFDHKAILGNSLEDIAFQKGGIIKSKIPVIIGEHNKSCDNIFEKISSELNSELIYGEDKFHVEQKNEGYIITGKYNLSIESSDIQGGYQYKNITTAITALEIIKNNFNISKENIIKGISECCKNTGLQGRWQIIGKEPFIICDAGHNEAGISFLKEEINNTPHEKLFIIMGVMADKDVEHILNLMPKNAYYFFCQTDSERAMKSKILYEKAKKMGLKGEYINNSKDSKSVKLGLERAKKTASSKDMIFIGGSCFIVADLLETL